MKFYLAVTAALLLLTLTEGKILTASTPNSTPTSMPLRDPAVTRTKTTHAAPKEDKRDDLHTLLCRDRYGWEVYEHSWMWIWRNVLGSRE